MMAPPSVVNYVERAMVNSEMIGILVSLGVVRGAMQGRPPESLAGLRQAEVELTWLLAELRARRQAMAPTEALPDGPHTLS